MRIGEFSKKHNLTIDTIRHYMDLELIIPEKNGAHYFFNNKCSDNLKEIIYLKETGFSLQEIQRIFALKRLAGLKAYDEKAYYKQIFIDKREALIESKNKIENMIHGIEERINEVGEIKNTDVKLNTLGVPLEGLKLLACPTCGKRLSLNHGEIKDDMVIQGELNCKCGEKIVIDDGIIMVDRNVIESTKPVEDWSIRKYLEETPNEFINFMYTAIEWIIDRMEKLEIEDKIILELGTGSGLFLSHFEDIMKEETLYIGVDYDLRKIKALKEYCEAHSKHKNYIFICCDMLDIPFKAEEIDIVIDYLGSTNYNFTKPEFLMAALNNKLKKGGYWFGSFFHFKSYGKSLQRFGEESVSLFKLSNIIKTFETSGFKILDRKNIGFVDRSGVFEAFLAEGDRVHQEVIIARNK